LQTTYTLLRRFYALRGAAPIANATGDRKGQGVIVWDSSLCWMTMPR